MLKPEGSATPALRPWYEEFARYYVTHGNKLDPQMLLNFARSKPITEVWALAYFGVSVTSTAGCIQMAIVFRLADTRRF